MFDIAKLDLIRTYGFVTHTINLFSVDSQNFSQNVSSLAITVLEWRSFEDLEEKDDLDS